MAHNSDRRRAGHSGLDEHHRERPGEDRRGRRFFDRIPITEAMAEEFQKANSGIKVTVGIGGTGGGFKKFCRGETDISDASRPITIKERDDCKKTGVEYVELPVALDALTVMVNPKNDWVKDMTVAELKKIWQPEAQGKITNWKQVRDSFRIVR